MAVQKLDAIDGMNQRQNRHFFTSYPEMNEVLNRFAAEADADEIWISAEVQELKENRSGNQLCQIVGEIVSRHTPTGTLHKNPLPGHAGADID